MSEKSRNLCVESMDRRWSAAIFKGRDRRRQQGGTKALQQQQQQQQQQQVPPKSHRWSAQVIKREKGHSITSSWPGHLVATFIPLSHEINSLHLKNWTNTWQPCRRQQVRGRRERHRQPNQLKIRRHKGGSQAAAAAAQWESCSAPHRRLFCST